MLQIVYDTNCYAMIKSKQHINHICSHNTKIKITPSEIFYAFSMLFCLPNLTAEPNCFIFLAKLLIGPGMVLGYFIFINDWVWF